MFKLVMKEVFNLLPIEGRFMRTSEKGKRLCNKNHHSKILEGLLLIQATALGGERSE